MSAPTQSPAGTPLNGHVPDLRADPFFYGWREVQRTLADGSTVLDAVPLTEEDVLYPQEGDHIAHNESHDDNRAYLKAALRWRLSRIPRAWVLSDHGIDFNLPGRRTVAPDITVLLDADDPDLSSAVYPLHEKRASPLLTIEITSRSTRNKDFGEKMEIFGEAGVPWYVIADWRPVGGPPRFEFHFYRHSPDGIARVESADSTRVWLPGPINLWLTANGEYLVCQEADGTPIKNYDELAEFAEHEKQRADDAIRKLQELEDELRRLRGD